MKKFWKGVLLLGMMVVFLAATTTVYAGQPDLKAPPPEQSKAYQEIGIESLLYLQDWSCSLIPSGGGKINLTGYTRAYQNVDYIMVKLYLQRWNGSSWVDLGGWTFEEYNASKVEGLKGLEVLKGYYYRVRAEHKLIHDGTTEPAKSFSDSYYIE